MKLADGTFFILQRGIRAEVAFWFAYTLITQLIFAPGPFHPISLLIMCSFLIGEVVAVYGHIYFGLIPLVRKRRKAVTYLGVVMGAWTLGVLISWACIAGVSLIEPELRLRVLPGGFWQALFPPVGWSVGSLMLFSSGILLFSYRRQQAQRERELEIAKTRAELAYLRGQLNPHFLFNALNNIYVLIDRDPDTARDCLLGFSDLLRYQLYAGEADRVPLTEEVEQLRKYARICRLRLEEGFRFDLETRGDQARLIPPMLLLPLVENAFKHGGGTDGFVRARLTTTHDSISFTIANSIGPGGAVRHTEGDGGIGLTNLRRRLDLLFPGRFTLDVFEGSGEFSVDLQLPNA